MRRRGSYHIPTLTTDIEQPAWPRPHWSGLDGQKSRLAPAVNQQQRRLISILLNCCA